MSVVLASLLLAAAAAEPSAAAGEAEPTSKPTLDLEALAKNSPFGAAPAAANTAKPVATSTLELRGMYREGETVYYSVYDSTTKQSRWISTGETADPAQPVVKSFDEATSTLVVETGGKALSLVMKPASVSKYEAPPAPRVAETGRGGPPLPEPGPDGKVQTPWGNFTPEQIAEYRAERERRWQERMRQMQAEGGRARAGETPGGEAPEGGGRRRSPR